MITLILSLFRCLRPARHYAGRVTPMFTASAGNANSAVPAAVPQCVARDGASFKAGNAMALALDGENWLNVAWPGEFPHPGGFNQRLEPEDIALCLQNFNTIKAAAGNAWAGLPLYLGHPEDDGSLATAPAYGWFKDARIGAGNTLQYRLEPTPEGKRLLDARSYKFISPYWYGSMDAANALHPHWVSSVGLTNNPVIKATQGNRPVANADGGQQRGDAASIPPDPQDGDTAAGAGTATVAAGTAVPAAPAATPVPAGNAAPSDTPWWSRLTGVLAGLCAGATDAESATEILRAKLSALYEAERQLQDLRNMIARVFPGVDDCLPRSCPMSEALPKYEAVLIPIATAAVAANATAECLKSVAAVLDVKPGEGGAIAPAAVVSAANALKTASAAAATAESAIRAEFAGFAVEQAIARGTVAANAQAEAVTIVTQNRSAALKLWFGSAAPTQGPVPAALRTPQRARPSGVDRAAANAVTEVPPADPTKGVALGNAGAGLLPAAKDAGPLVMAAAKKHQDANPGTSWGAANAWAWNQYRQGQLRPGAG